VLSATWPISDTAAAVHVFKAQLLDQRDIPSPSASTAGTANASTAAGIANASPSTSLQVCQASTPQTLHSPIEFHLHFTLCVDATHSLCLSDFERF